jgi:hypothetical protein
LETGSLTVELTPLFQAAELPTAEIAELKFRNSAIRQSRNYFTSLCSVCFRHLRQNLANSSRSGVDLRFFVVE